MIKPDAYTKGILTVIAACLFLLTFHQLGLFPRAFANRLPASGMIQGNYSLVPVNDDGSINVKISPSNRLDVKIVDIDTYKEMNVNIKGIETTEELDVNIDEVGGYGTYGKVPVVIK